MNILPSDIRGNILEYGGKQYQMRIEDIDIINRIHLYEPGFNYQEWKMNSEVKRQFIDRVSNSSLIPLYDYLMKNDSSMSLSDGNLHLFDRELTDHIIDLLKGAGYKDISIDNQGMIITSDPEGIRRGLLEISLWKSIHKHIPYSYEIFKEKMIGGDVSYLIHIANILPIPSTLAEYLRYRIYRNKMNMTGTKLYPLYEILKNHKWKLIHEEWNEMLSIEDHLPQKDEQMLIEEMERTLGKDNFRYYPMDTLFEGIQIFSLGNTDLKGLEIMEKFYHPYMIHDPQYFP